MVIRSDTHMRGTAAGRNCLSLSSQGLTVRQPTSIFGAEVEQVVDGVHHLLLLSLQGRAVPCGPAQLGLEFPDHPALPPHQGVEAPLLLLERLQLLAVSRLHFQHFLLQQAEDEDERTQVCRGSRRIC